MKRYDSVVEGKGDSLLVITSNLMRDIEDYDVAIAYNELVYFNDEYCDDSTLMLINLLSKLNIKELTFAGFDGRKAGKLHFVDDSLDTHQDAPNRSDKIKSILTNYFADIRKEFLTDSEYR